MSTPELFVCDGGGMWFTVHGRDEDGREYQIADLGDCGEFSTVLEPHEAAYYARLFAQAEKMKEALEGIIGAVNESRGIAGYHLSGDIAYWDEFAEIDNARVLLFELEETNDG